MIKVSERFLVALIFVCAPLLASAATWRPVVMTDNGMVASGHPLASEAGIRILREGGNAVDAAVAAWFVQGLVEPFSTGIGGDMFALIYLAKTKEVKFINGSGPAPKAATIDLFRSSGGIPEDGAMPVEVPGAIGGATLTVENYGALPLAAILAPAIEMAEKGYPISDRLGVVLQSYRKKLGKFEATKKIWFRDGKPLDAGDLVVNRDIASTFRAIAKNGSESFYRGDLARRIANFLHSNGGILSEADLAGYHAHEDPPISVRYRGLDVYGCPPNSQGHVMLQALKMLEAYDLKKMGHNQAQYLHTLTEALKLGFADRNHYVGDPRFVAPIPIQEMLSEPYAAARRGLIDPRRAIEGEAPPGDPRRPASALTAVSRAAPRQVSPRVSIFDDETFNLTTYLTVVDKDRNMVSITSSLNNSFGNGMVVEGAGFFLNNRMRYFSLDPKNVNALAPGKRTRQTINPQLVLRDGRPFMVFGTPGGDTQPQTQLQFFLNVVEFDMNVQQALESSAVISTSFRESTYPQKMEGKLLVPTQISAAVRAELAKLGHDVKPGGPRGVGAVKAILIHPRTGVLMGGVSPAGDSYVIGY